MRRYTSLFEEEDDVELIVDKLSDKAKKMLVNKYSDDKEYTNFWGFRSSTKLFTIDQGKKFDEYNNILNELKKYKLIKFYKSVSKDKGKKAISMNIIDITSLGREVVNSLQK